MESINLRAARDSRHDQEALDRHLLQGAQAVRAREDGRLHHAKVEAEFSAATVKRTRAQNGGFAKAELNRNKDLASAVPAHARPARASISKSKQTTSVNTPPEGFEDFWAAFGKRGDKPAAQEEYGSALKRPGVTPSVLLAAARSYRAGFEKRGDFTYQKHAERWQTELVA